MLVRTALDPVRAARVVGWAAGVRGVMGVLGMRVGFATADLAALPFGAGDFAAGLFGAAAFALPYRAGDFAAGPFAAADFAAPASGADDVAAEPFAAAGLLRATAFALAAFLLGFCATAAGFCVST